MRDAFTKCPNKLLKSKELSSSSKVVYLIIKSYDFGSGHAFPSYRRIHEDSGYSRSTISKAIKELIRINIMLVNQGNNLKKKSNVYTFLPESEWSISCTASKSIEFGIETHNSPIIKPLSVQISNPNKTNLIIQTEEEEEIKRWNLEKIKS